MRFPAIPQANWTPEQQAFAQGIADGPRGQVRGPFVPLMHNPQLAARVQELGAHLRFGTGLPRDLIEIAILMTAQHFQCAHIWRSHSAQALAAGVCQEIITALDTGERPQRASDGQRLVIRFCREILENNKVTTATFERAVEAFARQGVLDLTGVCGYYGLLAMTLNVASDPVAAEDSAP
jgi:4-carboxymuconolactone decarboxylase